MNLYQKKIVKYTMSLKDTVSIINENLDSIFRILNGQEAALKNGSTKIIKSVTQNIWDGTIPGSNGTLRLYSDDSGDTAKLQRLVDTFWIDTGNQWGGMADDTVIVGPTEAGGWDGIIPGSNGRLKLYSDDGGFSMKLLRLPEDAWKETGNQWG